MSAATPAAPADLSALVQRARAGEPHAVARLISVFQDRRLSAVEQRRAVLAELADEPEAVVVGITGTPGSGKSTLVGKLTAQLLGNDDALSVAVLAIDPSSPISGGALLGDRTRLGGSDNERLFFRSEAAEAELGGLSPSSFQVTRLLTKLFDCLIVETVGIGQSEGDVRQLADHVYLVLAPLGGDELQLMKAGIIEIPDAFIVNKSDEPAAGQTERQLRASLWLARPFDAEDVPVFRTSAKSGQGVPELVSAIAAQIAAGAQHDRDARDRYFFERWVKDEWGRRGVAHLRAELSGADGVIAAAGDFDLALDAFTDSYVGKAQR